MNCSSSGQDSVVERNRIEDIPVDRFAKSLKTLAKKAATILVSIQFLRPISPATNWANI